MKQKGWPQSKLFIVCVGLFLFVTFGMLFFVAKSEGVSMGIVVEILAFATAVILAIFGVLALLDRFQHKKMSKIESFIKIIDEERGGWVAGILLLLVAFAVFKWTFTLLEYLVICHVYGYEAWLHGLRVAHKSVLTNGDVLSGWPLLILNLGTFFIAAPLVIGSYLLFRYVGFRLKGRRLSDPKPKKKWISSGKSDSAPQ